MKTRQMFRNVSGFTLVEILIAVSVFAVVSTVISSLYIQSFRETRRANIQNQLYQDARFVVNRIADEVRNGMIDYDEYYNQNVVMPSIPVPGPHGLKNYGQNYGRYYSAFFNPGSDNRLGFECADPGPNGPVRNERECLPLRRTIDRTTGSNPFLGKARGTANATMENAFCGTVKYDVALNIDNVGAANCGGDTAPSRAELRVQNELYLISRDAQTKTILARERIGGGQNKPKVFALSLLRMKGYDTNSDRVPDAYVCADEFACRGTEDVPSVPDNVIPNIPQGGLMEPGCGDNPIRGKLPRSRNVELYPDDDIFAVDANTCDTAAGAFAKDFVPVSPLTVNITQLNFLISPLENPHYAFAEQSEQEQPRVTIILTVEPNRDVLGVRDEFAPFTIVETVSARVLERLPAPLIVE